MTKTRLGIILTVIALIFLSAGVLTGQEKSEQENQGQYADFKSLMQDMLDTTYIYIEEMNSAQSAEEVASAIENYALAMRELEPRMDAMDEKYPDITEEDYPEELEETMAAYGEMMVPMEEAMMKMFEYVAEPAVQEAMQLMQ